MFIVVLFTTAKLCKQPRCPITVEWIKKMWYIYTIKFHSAIRNYDIWFEDKLMKLEDVMLCEARLRKIKEACILSYVEDRYKR
jgi:hypothetical protein